jgi:cell division protein FtsX
MSLFRLAFRLFKMAVQNTFRNFWLSVITISMYMLTLLTINAVLFVNVFATAVTQQIEDKVEVSVYFKTDTSLDIVNAARGYIAGFAEVREAKVVTAEEAYNDFLEGRPEDDSVVAALDEIGDNPFGPSLVIRANDVEDFDFITSTLQGSQYTAYIEKTDAQNNAAVINNLSTFANRVQMAGLILSVFFALITFLILFNAIRMAIYVHREEIGIMKLVGASDAYVRMPFLIEGILYAVAACALLFGGLWAFIQSGATLPSWFEGVDVMTTIQGNFVKIALAELLASIAIGLLATWVALARHLRV